MKTIGKMFSAFFTRSIRDNNSELDMTKEQLRKHRICTGLYHLGTYLNNIFSFFLRLATTSVDQGKVILGLILFCLYYFSNTISRSVDGLLEMVTEQDKNNFNEDLTDKCVYALELTRGQVKSRDESHNCLYTLNNSEILSTVKNVLSSDWDMEIDFPFDIIAIFNAILSAVVAVATENTLDHKVMVFLIFSTLIVGFFIKYDYIKRIRHTHKIRRESGKKRESHKADLINGTSVCETDFEYRINEFREIIGNERTIGLQTIKSNTISNVLSSILQCTFQLVYIVLFVRTIGVENITTGSIAVMIGGVTIISSINRQMGSIINTMFRKINIIDSMEPYLDDFNEISRTLKNVKNTKKKNVDEIVFPSIEIGYEEDSDNDVPFKLISNKPVRIAKGEVAILKGASGSGKSTLMKVLTGQLVQENVTGLVKADYYMYYCKDQSLGLTNCLYDELFCKKEADLEKMKDILWNLHLWQEFSYNCKNVWQWLKEKKYNLLSDGQKQRIICAKILYWLDDRIDVVAFDEATSGLDADDTNGEGDAQAILEYIIRYCNKDKKRIVIIATHQDTEKLASKILPEYKVKNIVFRKNDTKNEIVFEN